jgi:hypothetical protein
MHHASRLALPFFVHLLVLSPAVACDPPGELSAQADAARWFDVQISIPDASGVDGYIITSPTDDGGIAVVSPGEACEEDGGAGDATLAAGPVDAGDAGYADASGAGAPMNACATPLAPGDLVFDEVMISSEPGSDDHGQWLEVRSTRACSVDLVGLHASAPHGQSAHTVDVTSDVWIPPWGFFLIADSLDPTENDSLPGLVIAWAGSAADALHKTSDTITLSVGEVTLDTLTYPDKKRTVATSMAFPAGCPARARQDFASWVPSVASWTPGFFGTPNAPNSDVRCTVSAVPTTCARARRGALTL